MLPFQGFCSYDTYPSLVNVMDGVESTLSSGSKTTDHSKSTDACKSHKEAERRRRQRINAHLSTLRTLLPNTTKTDKASLLAEVVHHLKDLKKQATAGGVELLPGEVDEATLMSFWEREAKMVKVSVCCEDRPELNRDLTKAIHSVRAKAVRAEMVTVGGRTRTVVVMQWAKGSGGEEDIGVLESALKAVVENRTEGSGLAHGNKRARVFGLGYQ